MLIKPDSTAAMVRGGILAGLAGTVVMTAFQELIEMPLTGRADSYAPADFAERALPIHAASRKGRRRLNYATHFALGTMWGTAYGLVARTGFHGRRAVAVVFASMYTGDIILNTALGLYQPSTWSPQDWATDLGEKLIQAAATGAVFDRFLDPARQSY